MKEFFNTLSYSKYVIFHPFDGFYEVKYRNRGNALIATLFFAINALLAVIAYQYNGFLVNPFYGNLTHMNSLLIILYNLSPLMIFVIGNYSTTTLFNGKGRIREIYIVVGYALLPSIIINIVGIIFSNVISSDEQSLYNMLISAGRIWSYIIAFCGLVIIHEYGFFKNILTLLATLLAIAIITFIGLLFFSLFQQLEAFLQIFIKELLVRLQGWFGI